MTPQFSQRAFTIASTNVILKIIQTLVNKDLISREDAKHLFDAAAHPKDPSSKDDQEASDLINSLLKEKLGLS